MSGVVNHAPGVAVTVGGNTAPIEPAYTKPNYGNKIASNQPVPSEPTTWKAPVVRRGQDTRGMRYLWADQTIPMPISPLGTGPDVGIATWKSSFQRFQGSLRDYGFYDLLYRSGYPGFNLGLSFRAAVNPVVGSGSVGQNNTMKPRPYNLRISILRRSTGSANARG